MENQVTELMRRLEADLDSGLSRRDIAKRAKVSEGTVRNALEGRLLSAEIIEKFARNYFRISLEEMYRVAGAIPRDDRQLRYQEEQIARDLSSLRDSPFYMPALRGTRELLDVYLSAADMPPTSKSEGKGD